MLATMSAREFAEWQAYLNIDKPGEARMDWRFAQLTALTANLHGRRRHDPPFTLNQFMPDLRTPEERAAFQLAERQVEAMREAALAKQTNGAG